MTQPTSPPTDVLPVLTGRVLGPDDVYIVRTLDGSDTIYNRELGVTYHSIFGAVSESRHVFLQHGLLTKIGQSEISVLEIGFGSGLNAFLSYLFSIRYDIAVHYTGTEPFPIAMQLAEQLDYPGYLAYPEEREIFLRMHETDAFVSDKFHFRKLNTFQLPDEPGSFDCIFFDAFAPATQPGLWSVAVFTQLYQLLKPGGCLVTYSAQGQVRRDLIQAGFYVERLSGPPGKREMLRGTVGS